MGEILFLAHRVPFPPNRGDKIRSHHLLRALAALAPVHVGCFGETVEDMAADSALADLARSRCVVHRAKPLARAGIEAIANNRPVSLTAFASGRLRDWIDLTLAMRPIDTVFVFSGQMGQYVPDGFRGRVIIDLCDVDSAKFEAYAHDHRGPRAALYRREARLLAREEARLVRRADAALLVTEAEVELLRARLPDPVGANVLALGNGIDTLLYDPARIAPHAAIAGVAGPHLMFTGQMDYPPNIAAVERFVAHILPTIHAHHPGAQFHIVGRAPTARVRDLAGEMGVTVWGSVPDIRPFIAAADLVVAPLAIARGVQNKVLEAMAMARPVVLSGEAATGITACDGEHFAIGRDDAALAARALALLQDKDGARRMGQAARRFVVERHGWDAMLAPLARLVGRGDSPVTRRDAA